ATVQAGTSGTVGKNSQNPALANQSNFGNAMPMLPGMNGFIGGNTQSLAPLPPLDLNSAAANFQLSAEELAQLEKDVAAFLQTNFNNDMALQPGMSGVANGAIPNLGLPFQSNFGGAVPMQPGTSGYSNGASMAFNASANTSYGSTMAPQPGTGQFTGGLAQSVEPPLPAKPGSGAAPFLNVGLNASGSARSVEPPLPVNAGSQVAPQPGTSGHEDEAVRKKPRIV
ncbi:hypothetical protein LPJ53_006581, partial [Coemansia erecta]